LRPNNFSGSVDSLLDLVAAFCLGEVEIEPQKPISPVPGLEEGNFI
jgi:hypothetical protein